MLLNETQCDAQCHHDRDHDCGPLIAQEIGCGRKREQKQIEWIDRPADQFTKDRMARLVRDLIPSH